LLYIQALRLERRMGAAWTGGTLGKHTLIWTNKNNI
jgi:hypothetical protein